MNNFTTQQQHTVDLLAAFFGDRAGALYEVNHRSLHELTSHARNSVLPQSAAFLAGLELARELLGEQLRSCEIMDSPAAIPNYLTLHFAGQQYESFVVLYLDAQNRLIASEELFRGTLTQVSVPLPLRVPAVVTKAATTEEKVGGVEGNYFVEYNKNS